MSSATALVASSSSTAAIAVAAGSTGQQAAGHFRGGQLQPINAQQHQNTEDLLLTQNNVNNPAAVPIQQQQRPNWAVVTTSSTVSPIGEQQYLYYLLTLFLLDRDTFYHHGEVGAWLKLSEYKATILYCLYKIYVCLSVLFVHCILKSILLETNEVKTE